jgi:hypothetical protein
MHTAVIISLLITTLSFDNKSLTHRFAVCTALSGVAVARSSEDVPLISRRLATVTSFVSGSGKAPLLYLKLLLHI